MGSVRVVSQRWNGTRARADEHVIYIDRPSGSVLKNRHYMACEDLREEVIANFRKDLIQDWITRGPMRAEIERITELVRSGQNVALSCWCAPKACHGDVIKQAIESLL